MANQFVWVDIPVKDLDRAIKFYSAVLGGTVHREEIPGAPIGVLPHSEGDVGGCLVPHAGSESGGGPLLYLNANGALRPGGRRGHGQRRQGSRTEAPDRTPRLPRDCARQRRQPNRAPFRIGRKPKAFRGALSFRAVPDFAGFFSTAFGSLPHCRFDWLLLTLGEAEIANNNDG